MVLVLWTVSLTPRFIYRVWSRPRRKPQGFVPGLAALVERQAIRRARARAWRAFADMVVAVGVRDT